MSKVSKIVLGAGVFLLLSGGLLALAGRAMGAETQMTWDTPYGDYRVGPFSIRGIYVDDERVDVGGEYGIHVGPEGVSLGGANGIGVTENGVTIGGHDVTYYGGYQGSASERPEWDVPKEFQGKDESVGLADLDAFTRLDVDVDMGSLVFQRGDSYGVELRWYANNGYRLDSSVKDGTLKVWSSHPDQRGMKNQKCNGYVVVTLPQDVGLEWMDVELDMGSFYVEDLIITEGSLDCSMGSITMLGVTAGSLDIDADMGSVEFLYGKVTEKLTAKASMGSVTLSGDLACDMDVDADMGSVEIYTDAGRDAYRYALDADMGSVELDGVVQKKESVHGGSGEHTLNGSAGMGSISIWFGGASPSGGGEEGYVQQGNGLPDYLYASYPEHEDKNVGFYADTLSHDFTVDETTLMTIDVENWSGDLELGIKDRAGGWALDQRPFGSESDEVELEPGRYTVVIRANAFQGSYELVGELV